MIINCNLISDIFGEDPQIYMSRQGGKYAGSVKRHNVCKRHVAIDTGFKQTERAMFLHVISMGLRW